MPPDELQGPFVEVTQDWESLEAQLSPAGRASVDSLRTMAVEVAASLTMAQAARYPQDMAAARQQVIEGKPSHDYRPPRVKTPMTRAEVERRAETIVQHRHARELAAAGRTRDAAIRTVFVAEGLVKEKAPERQRSSWRDRRPELRQDFEKER